MGVKRSHADAMDNLADPHVSPFMPMFESFKMELDEHHDRRERIIKASRDITAASKKIIFALQRIRKLRRPIPPDLQRTYAQHDAMIKTQYQSISKDLQGLNAWRYQRQISGGHQEFLEALTFQHYLETQQLVSYAEAAERVAVLGGDARLMLTPDDYLLGLFDMTGELMRFAITTMATTGGLPGAGIQEDSIEEHEGGTIEGLPCSRSGNVGSGNVCSRNESDRSVLADMRELRSWLERVEVEEGPLSRDVDKKIPVMKQSVEKVENAVYGLTIRGRERPKGWMPDSDQSGRQEVESF